MDYQPYKRFQVYENDILLMPAVITALLLYALRGVLREKSKIAITSNNNNGLPVIDISQ